MLLPFPAVGLLKTLLYAKGGDSPFEIQNLGYSGENIEVHFCGERIVVISFRHSVQTLRMFLERW